MLGLRKVEAKVFYGSREKKGCPNLEETICENEVPIS
jgi:hypothetical protein